MTLLSDWHGANVVELAAEVNRAFSAADLLYLTNPGALPPGFAINAVPLALNTYHPLRVAAGTERLQQIYPSA
jgi:hypothetical protein